MLYGRIYNSMYLHIDECFKWQIRPARRLPHPFIVVLTLTMFTLYLTSTSAVVLVRALTLVTKRANENHQLTLFASPAASP